MSKLMNNLSALREQEILHDIDLELCRFLREQHRNISEEVLRAACLVSYLYRQGDVCLSLDRYASQSIFDDSDIQAPDLETWKDQLTNSSLVGNPGDFKPLILDGNRLYLHKLWHYEDSLARQLIQRSAMQLSNVDTSLLIDGLDRLFPNSPANEVDWQRVAAAVSVKNKLSIISGGPGTGKTSTVVRMLALILEQSSGRATVPNIALAAPTGKAAARLKDSITSAKQDLNIEDEIGNAIPDETMTLHQLLGARRYTSSFKHDEDNPVPYDTVVVDEASMVDQALMAKLMNALLDDTRLILLGDKDQLASVEAGSVLGDICDIDQNQFSEDTAKWLKKVSLSIPKSYISEHPLLLIDHITLLTKSYRFGPKSGIAQLAESVNRGDADEAIHILESDEFADTSLITIAGESDLEKVIRQKVTAYYRNIIQSSSIAKALNVFNDFRLLSAHRRGAWGVTFINRYVEKILQQEKLIPKYGRWYPGKPVIVNVNDYTLQLHNGDTGVCLLDKTGTKKVYFRHEDEVRAVAPARLPDHNTAFALTVHKSQGSEFDEVLFILPNKPSNILSRELIYTAITRARTEITVLGNRPVLRYGVERKLQRSSGLRHRLWSE
jgi:exodeoxyribonuclease V alpha subunit